MSVAAAALSRLARRSLPQTDGTLTVAGLQAPVEVVRDRLGIPHLYAASRLDLARAQGYVHAQDRLFQMETIRRFAYGRLSEVAGARTLELDRLARRLRLRWAAEQDVALCDPDTAALVDAYCVGVNAFLARGPLPVEFRIARFRPEPWTPVDVQAPGQMFALSLSGNWEGELARARMGDERARRLDPDYPADHPLAVPATGGRGDGVAAIRSGQVPRGASNAFAVAGARTASGRPILANDPHLFLGIPGIWHAQHLVWEGGECLGFTVPGAPVVILGRNRRVAWGMTTAMIDTQDLFRERIDPDPEIAREEIGVRGRSEPVVEEVVIARHGPVVVPPEPSDEAVLALRWSHFEPGETLRSLLDLMTADTMRQAMQALDRFAGPPHNLVLADADGAIAYRLAGGPIPIRGAGDGRVPSDGADDWRGFIPADELPALHDPEHGFLVTANNQIVGDDYPYELSGEYLSGYRSRRLEELLAERDALTASQAARLLLDRRSLPGLELAAVARELEVD
ncbi:MAG: penicillin acylase family protein, partial [Actinomycetota bacterium]|nr:penicillin acylase family protein [Actinomycetota bacterium]